MVADRCRGTGYKSRLAIVEIFILDDEIRRMVNEKMSVSAIRQRARDLGMRTLREDGLRKVLSGMTTPGRGHHRHDGRQGLTGRNTAMNSEMLLNFLHDNSVIDDLQRTDLREEQSRTGKPIEEVLANSGVITLNDLFQMVATALGTEVVDVSTMEFPPELLSLVPPQTARLQGALPIDFDGSVLRIAVVNPLDPHVIDNLRFATQKDIAIYVAPPSQIQSVIERFYGSESSSLEDVLESLAGDAESKLGQGENIDLEGASSAPIIKYVNTVIAQAIQARASDIHFEPFEHDFKIRYRVDGALYEMSPPPPARWPPPSPRASRSCRA